MTDNDRDGFGDIGGDDEETWFEEGSAGLVRSYVVTGGRTRSDNYGLDMMTLVVALCSPEEATHLPAEYARIVRLCQRPMSVAEVGGHIDLPLPLVKVHDPRILGGKIGRAHVELQSRENLVCRLL